MHTVLLVLPNFIDMFPEYYFDMWECRRFC